MTISHGQNTSVFKDLKPLLTGQLILPEDETYDQARQLWNGYINKYPAALVRCANAQDVVHAVRWARSHKLALSVRGAGHDVVGRALCDDGIVIDCSQMRAVTVDVEARTARAQGGATVGDLIHATQKEGLGTGTGNVESVGLGGLTLGGGYGPLLGKFGMVADNLLSAQVVTADGNLVTASESEHTELLWGLKGGGGNFGVVVSLEYRLYPLAKVLFGWQMYPLDQAREALGFYSEFITTAPDELTVLVGLLRPPDAMAPVLFFAPTYCGPLEDGERVLKPLRAFGKPLADQIQPTPYEALITAINALAPPGRHYFMHTQSLETLRPETTNIIVEMAEQFSSPFSAITIHHYHGAASRVPVSATPFALRRDHLMIDIAAEWEPSSPEDEQKHIQWTQRGALLAPYALKGGYVNLLGEDEQDRVRLSYGPNYERLVALKRTYDPDDVFHSTIGHITPTIS